MASQRLEASDKVTLLLSFVPYLLRQGSATVVDLATTFDITEKQVVELIELLAVSGVPGEGGFYQHQDLFDINWELFETDKVVELWHHVEVESTPKFSAREAAALVAGLQYISSLLPEEEAAIQSLLHKISQAAASLPENILVASITSSKIGENLSEAISKKVTVTFAYQGAHSVRAQRKVDPVRLDLVSGTAYLRGWCHDRKDLRTFRVDRISELNITDQPVKNPISEKELSDDLFLSSETDTVAVFDVEDEGLSLIGAYQPRVVSKPTANTTQVEISFANELSIPIFVANYPGIVSLKSPARAGEIVRDWAEQALATYLPIN